MKSLRLLLLLSFFSFTVLHAQGVWLKKANFPGAGRIGATAFSIGTKAYVTLGYDDSPTVYTDLWEWDRATNSWTKKKNFPGPSRFGAVSFSIDSKGYIVTGSCNTSCLDLWEWDQQTDTWTQKANFPGLSRRGAVAFTIGTKAYIATGLSDNGGATRLQDLWEWDQSTNIWSQKANLPGSPRWQACGFSISNSGYLGLGNDTVKLTAQSHAARDFWQWDQSSNAWSQLPDFPGVPRFGAPGFSLSANGYVGNGLGEEKYTEHQDIWQWNPGSGWSQKASYPGMGYSGMFFFSIEGKGYIGGGSNFAGSVQDFWEFEPGSVTNIAEAASIKNLRVFPNPTWDLVCVNFVTAKKGALSVSVANSLGENVYSETKKEFTGEYKNSIDLSLQPKGMYLLTVRFEDGNLTRKIVIE